MDLSKYGYVSAEVPKGMTEDQFIKGVNDEISAMTERMWKSLRAEQADDHREHIELHNKLLAQSAVRAAHEYEIAADANGQWYIVEPGEVKKRKGIIIHDPCSHEWKQYVGFTQRYEYCGKCDAKRGEE